MPVGGPGKSLGRGDSYQALLQANSPDKSTKASLSCVHLTRLAYKTYSHDTTSTICLDTAHFQVVLARAVAEETLKANIALLQAKGPHKLYRRQSNSSNAPGL